MTESKTEGVRSKDSKVDEARAVHGMLLIAGIATLKFISRIG